MIPGTSSSTHAVIERRGPDYSNGGPRSWNLNIYILETDLPITRTNLISKFSQWSNRLRFAQVSFVLLRQVDISRSG